MTDKDKCITPGITPDEVEDKVHRFVHERMYDDEMNEFSEHICDCDHCSELVDEAIRLKYTVTIGAQYKKLLDAYKKKDWHNAAEAAKEMLTIGFDDKIWNAKEMIETAIARHEDLVFREKHPKVRESRLREIRRLRDLREQEKSRKKKSGEDE